MSFGIIVLASVFLAFLMIMRSCGIMAPPSKPLIPARVRSTPDTQNLAPPALPVTPPLSAPKVTQLKAKPPAAVKPPKEVNHKIAAEPPAADSLYVYADPWGGRHFDSVTVNLYCRQGCIVLYSLEGTAQLKTYSNPLRILKDTTLCFAGLDENANQTKPVCIQYHIERAQSFCPEGMMPFSQGGRQVCMDRYEWPNSLHAVPKAFVSHKEAEDSCSVKGKRLCSVEEWQLVCRGPQDSRYPYGNLYNENYCPSKEVEVNRSGRFPACRSYYGIYDLTGNLWEWTATPHKVREGYYLAAGGNWNTGDQATCSQTKYSFYPQNRYLFVGFRCCKSVKDTTP